MSSHLTKLAIAGLAAAPLTGLAVAFHAPLAQSASAQRPVALGQVDQRPNDLLPGATLPEPSSGPVELGQGLIEHFDSRTLLAQTRGVCTSQVGPAIDRIINAPAFANARWGIRVQADGEARPLYDRNSSRFLIPASNNKLFVTAAALQMFDLRSPVKSSISLADWVKTTNTRSDNDQADYLFGTVGGFRNIQRALATLGVNPDGFRMVDGSGLSRSNVTQPQTLVSLLNGMTRSNAAETFRSSLPIAGMTGTLARRFRETPAQGRVFAKTGTLTGVRALSGYMNHPLYDRLTFSILLNQSGQEGDTMLRAIDGIVLTLMQMRPCELGTPESGSSTPPTAPGWETTPPAGPSQLAPPDWQPAPARPDRSGGWQPGDIRPRDWRPLGDR